MRDSRYHWFGNAETYFYLGTAMGEATKHELEGTWVQPKLFNYSSGADAGLDLGRLSTELGLEEQDEGGFCYSG